MRKLILALCAIATCGFARPAHAKLHVVTTIETFADLAKRIGGDRVEVKALSKGYMDPHFVQPKPSLVIQLNRADLLIRVGLQLEIGWLPPLVLGARNDKIQPGAQGDLNISTQIPLLDVPTVRINRGMGDIHPLGNPHYWLPPQNAKIIASEIAARLKQLDPGGAKTYDANLATFQTELEQHRKKWEQQAASLRGMKVVTYHQSWSYVSQWLGLVEVGYIEPKPGIPAPPSHIAALIGLMRSDGVRMLMMESFYPRNVADLVCSKAGAKTVVLPSDVGADASTGDYFSLVDQVIAKLIAGAR
ncbi:MAG TPA: metal ABC transporter substrate-binding protein [Polyangia bacterium]|jgi:zinc/manganese transport system substrate-binding protein